jgi:DNA-binding IclR family transcriptional regulator
MMRFGREARQQRVVLEALEAVGDAGMSPNALAVTTQLPEQRLQVILQRLIESGAVDRRVERHPAGYRITRSRYRIAMGRAPRV